MIGIVLWSDTTAGKAVIWCEDQGELAFYSHVGTTENFAIRVGDWVSFDLKLKSDLRVALDIQVLREPGCPHLAENLAVADQKAGAASSLKLVAIGTGCQRHRCHVRTGGRKAWHFISVRPTRRREGEGEGRPVKVRPFWVVARRG
jgi:hypothetical protein